MIRGVKRYDGCLVSCNFQDDDCTIWFVTGPGSPSWMEIECDSLHKALTLHTAFLAAFNAGRRERNKELKAFLEGTDIKD